MDEVFRKRLSEDELAEYDRYDRRASIAGHFFVWPGIFGLISYTYERYPSAFICLACVVISLPVMIWMGGRAKKLREVAEKRYLGILAPETEAERAEKDA